MLRRSKIRAKLKNYDFDLDITWLQSKLDIGKCELTGIKFISNDDFRISPFNPSIDRIDSKKGYTKNNCRLICVALNLAIKEWGEDVFREILIGYWQNCQEVRNAVATLG